MFIVGRALLSRAPGGNASRQTRKYIRGPLGRNPGTLRVRLAAAVGLRLSDWFERWFPDAFALALVAVGSSSPRARRKRIDDADAQWFGAGFWDLVAFTMQMTLIIVTGYAVATAPPVYW